MGNEKYKYIKTDASTGKPEYLGKMDGQAIAGIPHDDDLCFITFKDI